MVKKSINSYFQAHLNIQEGDGVPRRGYRVRTRPDLINDLSDVAFLKNFRMSKTNVLRLVERLEADLIYPTNRNTPLTPLLQVLLTLNTLAGGSFLRQTGLIGHCDPSTVQRIMFDRVIPAILKLKDEFIKMPDELEMAASAQFNFDKFHLKGFAFGVDGVHCHLDKKPNAADLPDGVDPQRFWSVKGGYSINCQVVGNHTKKILDIVLDYPGSAHDSRIFKNSEVKAYLEQLPWLVAGDAGYAISTTLIKPYSTTEAANDPFKRLFNARLSGARTGMSEHIFGIWKALFPILRQLRFNLKHNQEVILATAILYNMILEWKGEGLVDAPQDLNLNYRETEAELEIVDEEERLEGDIRANGQAVRNWLLNDTPPPAGF